MVRNAKLSISLFKSNYNFAGSKYCYCTFCKENVLRIAYQSHLRTNKHKNNATVIDDEGVGIVRSAFNNCMTSYRIHPKNHHISVETFMGEIKNKATKILEAALLKFVVIKVNFEIFGLFSIESKDLRDVKSFNTKNVIVSRGSDLSEIYDTFSGVMDEKASSFQEKDSGNTKKRLT